jgi:hypothetical protein
MELGFYAKQTTLYLHALTPPQAQPRADDSNHFGDCLGDHAPRQRFGAILAGTFQAAGYARAVVLPLFFKQDGFFTTHCSGLDIPYSMNTWIKRGRKRFAVFSQPK